MKPKQRKIIVPADTEGNLKFKDALAAMTKDSIRQLERCREKIKDLEQQVAWWKEGSARQDSELQRLSNRVNELGSVVIHQAEKLYRWEKSRR